ncbi:PIN2/TERF1-interacting telomerase inhibitor 1 isoform X1 [Pezoporus wallicus]|uniref:PIN2/TERF1-interacting telomerase inhibitor 1 isoform X1 n=2 Tax=Pezoporus wallicus TaxID=35540 RepID=UPI00254E5140|nr:PIN2/TERF1-interacting telomerase inhibitor 1 isoform X1 [Pezoporus wallicus]
MAMLAEPRRRQKWSVDPRNSAWSKDESKFGQKMLEKMGWSKGKGLGAQEQGNTEHIKVQVKNNTLGLGATINYEDNWIAHQDDFNQLLAELNDCHGQGETESSVNNQKKTFSLEEKSKSSKKRVHYMKFAKGKDLSSRSEDDLSCIFGKRQKSLKGQEDIASPKSQEEKQGNCCLSKPADGYNTVTSVLTVQEYFAKRMAKLKGSQNDTEAKVVSSSPTADEALEPSEELKTKVKQKKHKQKRDEAKSTEHCEKPKVKQSKISSLNDKELDAPLNECHSRKKKGKHKEQHEGESISCDENLGNGEIHAGTADGEDLSAKDCEARQKKHHKKKHKRQKEDADECIEGAQKKKKKHCKHI